jgi:hypothetical protein
MTALCARCNLPAHPGDCYESQRVVTLALIRNVGTLGHCRGCDRDIYWVRHANGKSAPYDPTGLIHFVSCEKAAEFKKGAPA